MTPRMAWRIKVRDSDEAPTAKDLKCIAAEKGRRGLPTFGLAADAKHAHKLVLIRPADWGLQACRAAPGDPLFINTRGTYGLASAAYWWGRLGAGLVRAAHYFVGNGRTDSSPGGLWLTRFADDFNLEGEGPHFATVIVMTLLFWVVLGVPMAWSKCRGGRAYDWVGYELLLQECALGISEKRAAWVKGWYVKVLTRGTVSLGELRAAVGRLCFVCGALRYDRPFIAPIYAFVGALARKRSVAPDTEHPLPQFLRMIFGWLLARLQERRHERCSFNDLCEGQLFRVDAKAEGSTIVLGGWKPTLNGAGKIDPRISPWFSTRLTRENAPWAFDKAGQPFRVISALELLATTVAFILFAPSAMDGARRRFGIRVSSWTDSQVATAAAAKGLSASYPLCLVQMELSAQMESRRAILEPEWAPREVNQEADALTNEVFGQFAPDFRISATMDSLPWVIFPRLVDESRNFYAELIAESSRTGGAGVPAGSERPALSAPRRPHRLSGRTGGLRVSDPW